MIVTLKAILLPYCYVVVFFPDFISINYIHVFWRAICVFTLYKRPSWKMMHTVNMILYCHPCIFITFILSWKCILLKKGWLSMQIFLLELYFFCDCLHDTLFKFSEQKITYQCNLINLNYLIQLELMRYPRILTKINTYSYWFPTDSNGSTLTWMNNYSG